MATPFLKTKKRRILHKGKPVSLKGLNLGGWLMMEAYILYAPNFAEQLFKKKFQKALGAQTLRDFEYQFRRHFIQESDIRLIKKLGFNCVRVPFNYRLVEEKPFKYSRQGVGYLDRVIQWAKEHKLLVILDLHGAPGAQNHDWHSDSLGPAGLWSRAAYRQRTYALWEFLADRFRNEPAVAGYDLLNEAVTQDVKGLNAFYRQLIKTIRRVDQNHILFIEGNRWAQDLDCLDPIEDDNYALSIHSYEPLNFTFNFIPHLAYPLHSSEGRWDKKTTRTLLQHYAKISQKQQVPIYVGEFGVNYRQGLYNEHIWLKDTLSCFNEFDFHWTYWPYKAIKNDAFPDGLYSYYANPPWVNRPGPVKGWDTYHMHWTERRKEMIRSWHTDQFKLNKKVYEVLQHAL